jgi:hypothetical protein|tara:strand:- start:1096 stop:1374 length:279 start_codon:yes stop_codon:yes gene_type:complete
MANKKKHANGYATFDDGLGFREIAELLHDTQETPKKMRHTSIRNYFLRGMEKLAEPIAKQSGRTVREIARDPRFQTALAEILRSKDNNGIDL